MSLLGRIRRMLGFKAPSDDERARKAQEIEAQTVKSEETLRRVRVLRSEAVLAQHRLGRR